METGLFETASIVRSTNPSAVHKEACFHLLSLCRILGRTKSLRWNMGGDNLEVLHWEPGSTELSLHTRDRMSRGYFAIYGQQDNCVRVCAIYSNDTRLEEPNRRSPALVTQPHYLYYTNVAQVGYTKRLSCMPQYLCPMHAPTCAFGRQLKSESFTIVPVEVPKWKSEKRLKIPPRWTDFVPTQTFRRKGMGHLCRVSRLPIYVPILPTEYHGSLHLPWSTMRERKKNGIVNVWKGLSFGSETLIMNFCCFCALLCSYQSGSFLRQSCLVTLAAEKRCSGFTFFNMWFWHRKRATESAVFRRRMYARLWTIRFYFALASKADYTCASAMPILTIS